MIEVDGQLSSSLTENEAWELMLLECGKNQLSNVKMRQGDKVVAGRSTASIPR